MRLSVSMCGALGLIVIGLTGCLHPTTSQTCPLPPVTETALPPTAPPPPDWRPGTTTEPPDFGGVAVESGHPIHVLISNPVPEYPDPDIAAEDAQGPIGPPRRLLP